MTTTQVILSTIHDFSLHALAWLIVLLFISLVFDVAASRF